jgi:hypothetical protein
VSRLCRVMKTVALWPLVCLIGCESELDLVGEKERVELERVAAQRALTDVKREVEALHQEGKREERKLDEEEEHLRNKRRVYQMRSSTNGPPLTCECVGQEPCRCY